MGLTDPNDFPSCFEGIRCDVEATGGISRQSTDVNRKTRRTQERSCRPPEAQRPL